MFSIRKISKEMLAMCGLSLLLLGNTVSSALFGSLTREYYAIILFAWVLCTPLVFRQLAVRNRVVAWTFAFCALPILVVILQSVRFEFGGSFEPGLIKALALSIIFYFVGVAALLSKHAFQLSMSVVAAGHILFIIYAIAFLDVGEHVGAHLRFSALGLGVAAWGEVALGLVLAAILSGRRILLYISLPLASILVFLTQMRGSGLALVAALLLFLLYSVKNAKRLGGYIAIFSAFIVVLVVLYYQEIREVVMGLLLWDDPHRGIQTGFSGRVELIESAVRILLENPLLGVGTLSSSVIMVHNGLLLAAVEYGVFLAGILFFTFGLALRRAIRVRDPFLVAAMISYLVFIISTPRYVNLQLMPMVALLASGFALAGKTLKDDPRLRKKFGLDNFPGIDYKTGDYGEWRERRSAVGRPRISRVIRR